MCGCIHGYYGAACDEECPGGADYPCYGKGMCDTVDGTCTCQASANMNSDCSACNFGWSGEDCSIADTGLQGMVKTDKIRTPKSSFCKKKNNQ